jgi:hypothetical protein
MNAKVPPTPIRANSTTARTTTGVATPSSVESVDALSADSVGAVEAAGAVVDELGGVRVVGVVEGAAVVGAAVVGGVVAGAAACFWPRPATAGGAGGSQEIPRLHPRF